MEINRMLKRQEHFFQSQKTKKYEFRKKALLRLECAIKQHEEDIEHALYKDLGKSSFESYMAEIGMVKSELSYVKKHLKKWMKTEFTTLFEQLLLPKLLPCRFISTFIYKQREKNGIKY